MSMIYYTTWIKNTAKSQANRFDLLAPPMKTAA
jgi:hypothetical protein